MSISANLLSVAINLSLQESFTFSSCHYVVKTKLISFKNVHFNTSPTHKNTTDTQKVLHHPPTSSTTSEEKMVNWASVNEACVSITNK